eukprot:306947-Amphidinium_carterae.1
MQLAADPYKVSLNAGSDCTLNRPQAIALSAHSQIAAGCHRPTRSTLRVAEPLHLEDMAAQQCALQLARAAFVAGTCSG